MGGRHGSRNPRRCHASTAARNSGESLGCKPPLVLLNIAYDIDLHCPLILGVWSTSSVMSGLIPRRSPLPVNGHAVGRRSEDGTLFALSLRSLPPSLPFPPSLSLVFVGASAPQLRVFLRPACACDLVLHPRCSTTLPLVTPNNLTSGSRLRFIFPLIAFTCVSYRFVTSLNTGLVCLV